MSSDISFPSKAHPHAGPSRSQESSPRATRKPSPIPLSEAGSALRANLAGKNLRKIKGSEIGKFIDEILPNLDANLNSAEVSKLIKIKKLSLSTEKLDLAYIITEYQININDKKLDEKIQNIIKSINIDTIRLVPLNEKNPLIKALKSLYLAKINELKSTISPPEILKDFFENLESYATFYQAECALKQPSKLLGSLEAIQNLIYVASNLIRYNENDLALKVLRLIIKLTNCSEESAQKKISILRPVAVMLFLLEEKSEGHAIFEKARALIQDVPSIEDKIEDLGGLAIDYFALNEESRLIEIINLITQASYFSSDDRVSTFQGIFQGMLDDDGMDFLLNIIEQMEYSKDQDLALQALVSSLLEDVENEDAPSQALQLAECIQDERLREEAMNLFSEGGEIEA